MNPDHGVLYGVAFDTVLFGGMLLFFGIKQRLERARWRKAHPPVVGSARRLLARLARLARPTLLLIPAAEPRFSKLGGAPQLPVDVAWPQGRTGPRIFLAQIDFGEFQPESGFDWLPAEGRIYAFYDPDGHGAADVAQIVYSAAAAGPVRSDPPRPPPERHVAFKSFRSMPSPEWLNATETLDLDVDAFGEQVEALREGPPDDEMQHRIGGYPNEIQNGCLRWECEHLARNLPPLDYKSPIPLTFDRASKAWRLLLQIDSDPGLKMNWGDGGRLYVFIREKDARAGDFSRTVTISQCY